MRRYAILVPALAALLMVAACGGEATHDEADHGHDETAAEAHQDATAHGDDHGNAGSAMATMEAKSGSTVAGTAAFASDGSQVTLTLELTGVPAGTHAVHLHQVGDCSADDGTSAGGHWNPTGEEHGKWGEGMYHLGDIGNVTAGDDGSVSLTFSTDKWGIGTGDDHDIVGRAVIVHAMADDYTSQPTGAAGGRIACGVISTGAH